MDNEQAARPVATHQRVRRTCLVAGCPCEDPRIVSHRRAAFFATLAKTHGETADRTIEPDPTWRLPTSDAPAA
ncbi:MAG TPA: hypothetical protein VGQ64_09520 [Candidatus Limnocylindrales bacterium]|jgi:hypothetical protein|nr:hypothetical protein [Candidatus Limnocylindrales bacterium]